MKTMKVSVNKSEIMKDAYRMYKSESNKEQKASFAELLSLTWAVAKQSLYTYLTTGYANNYITVTEG